MDKVRHAPGKDRKMEKKPSVVSRSSEGGFSNCSPEYVRTRRSTNRRTAILDIEAGKNKNSLQSKAGVKKRKVSKQLFPSKREKVQPVQQYRNSGKEVMNTQECQPLLDCISGGHKRSLGKKEDSCTMLGPREKQSGLLLDTRWPTGWYSDDEGERLADINDDQQQLEGYSSEKEKEILYGLSENQSNEVVAEWFTFDDSVHHRLLLYHGQRFKNVGEFRKAIQVYAIREGFNLCVMENRNEIVSCECSDLSCDWHIKAVKLLNMTTFVITEFLQEHNCIRRGQPFNLRSKWIAAMYLHRWRERPSIRTAEIREEIESTYGVKCPEWKVFCAANRAKQILGLDHDNGYAMLHQFKEEMERIDRHNIVLLETERHESREHEVFKRMFVCCERTSYAFKTHCRGILVVDGWKINNPCNSVMLVAAGLDGNNGILPLAFCEVEVEDLESWVYFLKNINTALRLDYGKGLCIMGDGDNDLEYAVEEFLHHAVYRQCCHRIFTEMVKRFPTAPVQHLFWSACRSTSATSFFNYMDLICRQSQECHDWLKESNWERWALFCMPHWVKCSCVTLMITEKLRSSFHQYLDMNITARFAAIARLTADVFEQRRMVVWKWYREKVTPTVRDIIADRSIDGQRFSVHKQKGTMLELTDTISSCYDVNLEAMSCTCGLWQISGIPCAHACRGIQHITRNIEDYVDNMMSVTNYMSTYAPGMDQLPKEYAWKWDAGHNLLPPMTLPVKTNLAKASIDTTTNTALPQATHQEPTNTHNLQSTQESKSPNSSEQDDTLTRISTSSSPSISQQFEAMIHSSFVPAQTGSLKLLRL